MDDVGASTTSPPRPWTDCWRPRCSPPAQEADLVAYRDSLNPARIAREIADLQAVLLKLPKDKTKQLYLATIPTALPEVRNGIPIKAS